MRAQQAVDSVGNASPSMSESNVSTTARAARPPGGEWAKELEGINFGDVGYVLPRPQSSGDAVEDWKERQRRDFHNYVEQVHALSRNRESSGAEKVENSTQNPAANDPYEALRSSMIPAHDKQTRARYRWERFSSYVENAERSRYSLQGEGG